MKIFIFTILIFTTYSSITFATPSKGVIGKKQDPSIGVRKEVNYDVDAEERAVRKFFQTNLHKSPSFLQKGENRIRARFLKKKINNIRKSLRREFCKENTQTLSEKAICILAEKTPIQALQKANRRISDAISTHDYNNLRQQILETLKLSAFYYVHQIEEHTQSATTFLDIKNIIQIFKKWPHTLSFSPKEQFHGNSFDPIASEWIQSMKDRYTELSAQVSLDIHQYQQETLNKIPKSILEIEEQRVIQKPSFNQLFKLKHAKDASEYCNIVSKEAEASASKHLSRLRQFTRISSFRDYNPIEVKKRWNKSIHKYNYEKLIDSLITGDVNRATTISENELVDSHLMVNSLANTYQKIENLKPSLEKTVREIVFSARDPRRQKDSKNWRENLANYQQSVSTLRQHWTQRQSDLQLLMERCTEHESALIQFYHAYRCYKNDWHAFVNPLVYTTTTLENSSDFFDNHKRFKKFNKSVKKKLGFTPPQTIREYINRYTENKQTSEKLSIILAALIEEFLQNYADFSQEKLHKKFKHHDVFSNFKRLERFCQLLKKSSFDRIEKEFAEDNNGDINAFDQRFLEFRTQRKALQFHMKVYKPLAYTTLAPVVAAGAIAATPLAVVGGAGYMCLKGGKYMSSKMYIGGQEFLLNLQEQFGSVSQPPMFYELGLESPTTLKQHIYKHYFMKHNTHDFDTIVEFEFLLLPRVKTAAKQAISFMQLYQQWEEDSKKVNNCSYRDHALTSTQTFKKILNSINNLESALQQTPYISNTFRHYSIDLTDSEENINENFGEVMAAIETVKNLEAWEKAKVFNNIPLINVIPKATHRIAMKMQAYKSYHQNKNDVVARNKEYLAQKIERVHAEYDTTSQRGKILLEVIKEKSDMFFKQVQQNWWDTLWKDSLKELRKRLTHNNQNFNRISYLKRDKNLKLLIKNSQDYSKLLKDPQNTLVPAPDAEIKVDFIDFLEHSQIHKVVYNLTNRLAKIFVENKNLSYPQALLESRDLFFQWRKSLRNNTIFSKEPSLQALHFDDFYSWYYIQYGQYIPSIIHPDNLGAFESSQNTDVIGQEKIIEYRWDESQKEFQKNYHFFSTPLFGTENFEDDNTVCPSCQDTMLDTDFHTLEELGLKDGDHFRLVQTPTNTDTHKLSRCGHLICKTCLKTLETERRGLNDYCCPVCREPIPYHESSVKHWLQVFGIHPYTFANFQGFLNS